MQFRETSTGWRTHGVMFLWVKFSLQGSTFPEASGCRSGIVTAGFGAGTFIFSRVQLSAPVFNCLQESSWHSIRVFSLWFHRDTEMETYANKKEASKTTSELATEFKRNHQSVLLEVLGTQKCHTNGSLPEVCSGRSFRARRALVNSSVVDIPNMGKLLVRSLHTLDNPFR